MLNFFNQVIGYIETIWSLVVGLVQSLLMAIKFLFTGLDSILYLAGFVPAIIGSCIIIFLFIFVIKFVLGR